ncbi:zinc finger BED domain-containing protein 4 [Cottoperca gobio]|uniref:Zinc finger BED domain-containing protein 4 n=1 Tax=Cottoperca gobio TaxID=56716 RepID=A0A6J2REG8_COTGO|nr:zinc finger BED domain-containing protein 4-like [Cottoperca gobio]
MASPVWQFYRVFEKDMKLAVCMVCLRKIPRGGTRAKNFNTTNLIRHLKVSHIAEYEEFSKMARTKAERERERLATPQLSVTETLHPHSKNPKEISAKIMEFICRDHQPLSIVEGEGFRELISDLEPRYTLPGRKYFTDVCLPQLYQSVYTHVHSLMKHDITTMSFTGDICCSSVCPMSMLSLTARFIDPSFALHDVVLHSRECSGSPTAEALPAAFRDMLRAWGIPKEKVHVILRADDRDMEKALRDEDLPSLPCMAHTLQLAVSEEFLSQRSITDIITSGRCIVSHFKHSQLAYSRLESIQKQLDQPMKRLQQDVPTRWNSTLYMLQSLLEHKRALCAYGADYDLPSMFTGSQWKLVENVISLLAPFEELRQQISSPTASAADVIPSIRALTRLLEKTEETDHDVKTLKATLLEAVQKKFSDLESERLYTIAAVLDPRYKDRYFTNTLKQQIRGLLCDVLSSGLKREHCEESLTACSFEPPEKVPRAGSLHAMYAELLDENGRQGGGDGNPTSSEMNLYLSEPVIPRSEHPLVFWQDNKSRFPVLAQAARAYLCAPCTSEDSEQLFSTAANIVDDERNKLTAENAEMLIFIKKNMSLMLNK